MEDTSSDYDTVSRHVQAYMFEFHILLRAQRDMEVAEERERKFYQWWSTLSPVSLSQTQLGDKTT